MDEFYLISGALLMSAAIVLAFRSSSGSAVAAYAGVWAMRASGYAPVSSRLLLFWAIAVLIVVSIDIVRRAPLMVPNRARYFIAGGSLAGMAAGLMFSQAGVIICSTAGVLLGLGAYMSLSRMRQWNIAARWAIATGLPAIVTMTLVAIGIQGILAKSSGI